MPTLSLTLDGANGEAHDWNDVLVPMNEIKTLANTTKLDYLNVQTNGLRADNVRAHAAVNHGRQKVWNASGGTLAANKICYFSGTYSDGTDNFPTVDLADANTALTTHKNGVCVIEAAIGDVSAGVVHIRCQGHSVLEN
jgi:hypothetical protein